MDTRGKMWFTLWLNKNSKDIACLTFLSKDITHHILIMKIYLVKIYLFSPHINLQHTKWCIKNHVETIFTPLQKCCSRQIIWLAKSLYWLMEISVSPHCLWPLWWMPLVHVGRLPWAHDNVYGYGKREAIQHLCDLLLGNAVLVPPWGRTSAVGLMLGKRSFSKSAPACKYNMIIKKANLSSS